MVYFPVLMLIPACRSFHKVCWAVLTGTQPWYYALWMLRYPAVVLCSVDAEVFSLWYYALWMLRFQAVVLCSVDAGVPSHGNMLYRFSGLPYAQGLEPQFS